MMRTPWLLRWSALLFLASAVRSRRPDFECTRVLPDGEVERRVQKGRVSTIETTVEISPGRPTTDPAQDFFEQSTESALSEDTQVLTLLQVTDGRHFIQLIYDSGWQLRDCEYLKSSRAVQEFYQAFDAACPLQQHPRNESLAAAAEVPDKPDVTDYGALRRKCKSLHRRVRDMALHHGGGGVHHQLERLKRDLFLYPGTNWCGSGSNARKFNELGYNAAADRCCRDHDHCPHTIEGFTSKYNFFNFRFHTISHCDCDERFRACLKLSSTAAGNMVGKLFFNVVQTKCFLFKHVKKCGKRSWWGKCLKFEKEKMAFLRDALKY